MLPNLALQCQAGNSIAASSTETHLLRGHNVIHCGVPYPIDQLRSRARFVPLRHWSNPKYHHGYYLWYYPQPYQLECDMTQLPFPASALYSMYYCMTDISLHSWCRLNHITRKRFAFIKPIAHSNSFLVFAERQNVHHPQWDGTAPPWRVWYLPCKPRAWSRNMAMKGVGGEYSCNMVLAFSSSSSTWNSSLLPQCW